MSGSKFVGQGRHDLVQAIVERFDEVSAGSGPRLVALSAITGQGKTRVVQEFYAQLAASQQEPKYWPNRLDGNSDRWTQLRKRVAPEEFDVPAKARIPWIWWGVSCAKRPDGRFAQALFDDATQLGAHAGSLYERMRADQKASVGVDGTIALLDVLGLLGLALAPPVGVAMMGGGLIKTLWDHRELSQRLKTWKERRQEAKNDRHLDLGSHGREGDIAELAQCATSLSRQVPLVLVVDDAHWADRTLVEFVDKIMRDPTAQVLVIATSWPTSEKESEPGPFSSWLIGTKQNKSLAKRVDLLPLDSLAPGELDELIHAKHAALFENGEAALTDETAAAIRDMSGSTPMGIEALLDLPRVREAIRIGDPIGATRERLPRDLEAALQSYWDDIPREVQSVLALAAVEGQRFLPGPVIAAATAQGIQDARDRLQSGKDTYQFLRDIEEELTTFIDPIFWETAERAAHEVITKSQRADLYTAVAEFALSASLEEHSPRVCEQAWSSHVAAAMEGFLDRDRAAASAVKLSELRADRGDLLTAIDDIERGLGWSSAPPEDPWTLKYRLMHSGFLMGVERNSEAVEALRSLAVDTTKVFGSISEDSFMVRMELGLALTKDGRADEAISIYKEMFVELASIQLEDWNRTLVTELASALPEDFLPEDLEKHAWITTEVLNNGMIDGLLYNWLLVMKCFGITLLASGQPEEASDVFGHLLRVQDLSWFPDSGFAFFNREHLATALAKAGRNDESTVILEQLVVDKQRVLGVGSPETLETRYALLRGRLRELDERFGWLQDLDLDLADPRWSEYFSDLDLLGEDCKSLDADAVEHLGPNHPFTVNWRRWFKINESNQPE
jgi:tetratricopeptide (TPR) repeat protein